MAKPSESGIQRGPTCWLKLPEMKLPDAGACCPEGATTASHGRGRHGTLHTLSGAHHALARLHRRPQTRSFRAETRAESRKPPNPQRPGAAWPIGSKHPAGTGQAHSSMHSGLVMGRSGRVWLVDAATGPWPKMGRTGDATEMGTSPRLWSVGKGDWILGPGVKSPWPHGLLLSS